MDKPLMLWQAINDYGFNWVAARLAYEAQVRSGFQTLRFSQRSWADNELARWLTPGVPSDPIGYADYWRQHLQPFFFQPTDRAGYCETLRRTLGDAGIVSLRQEAEQIRQGSFNYFFSKSAKLGFPPDWHYNPFTGQRTQPAAHWSRIPMFSRETGDFKFIWEPGRFASAYTLARAYWATGDESHGETFWQLVESWAQANPPNHGAHWKCGQETSLRLMAWCFALYAFADAVATTPDRLALLVGMMAAQADRVAGDHLYAKLQGNNHAISEGVGLWTVGLLFPELSHAGKWRAQGREILIHEAARQIATDGSYIQNSMNYHRLMLQDYLWCMRLGELHGQPFSADLKERVSRAGSFLYQVQNKENGRVPNYGHNDGAMILPLNNCDYRDFRPVVQATQYLSNGTRCYDPGPWNEDLLWLFGPAAKDAPMVAQQRNDLQAEIGGYYTLRSSAGFAFVRCASFRDRPGQADMLHVDLWWRGQNIALDAGTYSYNAPAPWNNSLAQTIYHNTVTVDKQDQMDRAGKFMWVPWLRSRVRARKRSSSGQLSYWEGEHNGYERLTTPVSHHRAIIRIGDQVWIVLDELDSSAQHSYRLQWLFDDFPYEWNGKSEKLTMQTPAGSYYVQVGNVNGGAVSSLVRADQESPRGWHSPYYNSRQPALSVDLSSHASSVLFWSVFSPELCSVAINEKALGIKTERWHAAIELHAGDIDQPTIAASIAVAGVLQDHLQIS